MFGNQKSGTTAIASLLASATGQSATLDFDGATQPYVAAFLRGDMAVEEFVRRNSWAFSSSIIKEPTLTFAATRLMDHFQESRALFILRNPYENIRSMLVRQRLRGDLLEIPRDVRFNPTWRKILSGTDIGVSGGHYIDVLARRWLRAVNIYEYRSDRFVLVRYESFNAGKKLEIERIARALELQIVADITPLLEFEFQRRDTNPVPVQEFFGDNYSRIGKICENSYYAMQS